MYLNRSAESTFSADWSTRLFLLVLRLVVYSGSGFLAKVLLSIYGLTRGVVIIPRKRMGAVKSLLRYGVDVLQKKIGSFKEK